MAGRVGRLLRHAQRGLQFQSHSPMKTKSKFRLARRPELVSLAPTKNMARAFSRRGFLLAAVSLGLVAVSSAAIGASKGPRAKTGPAVRAIALPHVAPIVTNTDDSGPGSLRQALFEAQDGDVITFNISPPTRPGAPSSATPIVLTTGELLINHN